MTRFLQNMARPQFNRWDLLDKGFMLLAVVDFLHGVALWVPLLTLGLSVLCGVVSSLTKSSR